METEDRSPQEALHRELDAGLDLLDRLSTVERIQVRDLVKKLSEAIDEIRGDGLPGEGRVAGADSGVIERIARLEDLRVRLLVGVVFGDFEVLDGPDVDGGSTQTAELNIVVDGVPLAYERLF